MSDTDVTTAAPAAPAAPVVPTLADHLAALHQRVRDCLGAFGEATYAWEVWGGRREQARKDLEAAQAELTRKAQEK